MSSTFFLVQWMPGPCTEPGTGKEFSIIGLEDIKEDYRYALENGRITMATYRFRNGTNVGTMHRLCKILGSAGDKSPLEVEMMAVMNSGEDGSAVYTIEDEKPNHLTLRKQSCSRPPPWEVEKEMLTLLEENHKVRRENEALRTKLTKAVDVGDLKNILETTILNIQQKQIVQPSLDEQPSSSQASQPIIETLSLPQSMDMSSQPQLSNPVANGHTMSAQRFSMSPPGTQRQPVSRRTQSMNPMSHQLPRTSSAPTAPSHSQSRVPESELDNPYIVRVQSLAEPTPATPPALPPPAPHPVGIRPAVTTASINQIDRGYMRPSPQSNQRKSGVRQRQIKTPQWQSSYISDGITERLRIGRSGKDQTSSISANNLAGIPTTSEQRVHTIQMKGAAQRSVLKLDDVDGDKLIELVPGLGIWLPRKHLKLCQRTKGYSQYTRKLVMLLFNMKELSTSSVTGFKATGKGSENAIARPALDPKRVQAIITAVQKRFPAASPFKVKQVMSQKLMDIRKTVRNKQLKNATWKQRGSRVVLCSA
ncbi:uncharacterized protein LOC100892520 [Strongylocentrotus purpuratus]|uniref:BEN domain-containing protein n=1 Tax=Strongylocentrotus purpuratus TaxID=7668 RepID=A0A7M7GQK2_STRPU|nr:uncharacterized protein LOC100892520 [Strongylocentrotus purpuratus]|eukprot:XP_003728247.1 PREDICTED: uncharacterized protein LOC100892520 [Strongylocentrotus purpuratus]